MTKYILSIIAMASFVFAEAQQANLFTIPNQSAQFVRMPSRATMIDVDAVFFNPANLPSLGSGFHISINNQILNQFSSIIVSKFLSVATWVAKNFISGA